jgi:tRNA A-37 threonylcarbamoyl transferase component Bud32
LSASAPTLVGSTIGEYEIVGELGSGGMGVVYEGRQPLIGKRVAVKVLRLGLADDEEQAQRFLAEARAVNAIRHRGIVDIFGFGQLADGSRYFVMEYLEGATFAELIAHRAPLPVAEALQWTEEVLEALGAAHRINIIHRDVKPSNLFLVDGGLGRPYVKLLDFGIAKAVHGGDASAPKTRDSIIMGTPNYMAPEQILGAPVSAATDLYALGLVLYELLTGRRAFVGDTPLRTMWLHAQEPPPYAADLNPRVPAEVDAIIHWMLAKRAEDRPATAEAVRERLARVRQTLPSLPPPVPALATGPASRGPPPRATDRALSLGSATDLAPVASAPARPLFRLRAAVVATSLLAAVSGVGFWAWVQAVPTAALTASPRRGEAAPTTKPKLTKVKPPASVRSLAVSAQVEEPAQGGVASGIGHIYGWAVAPPGIDRVELYVDGQSYGSVPYGFRRGEMDNLFPGYAAVHYSGFGMAFNYAELEPGMHSMVVRAIGRDGNPKDVKTVFTVVRFHNSFVPRREDVSLTKAKLRGVGNAILLETLLVEGVPYDAVMTWSPFVQGFGLTQIDAQPPPRAKPRAFVNPAQRPGALPGLGLAITTAPKSNANGGIRWSLDEPAANGTYSGFTMVRGWAMDLDGIEAVTFATRRESLLVALGGSRPDVAKDFPDIPDAAKSGFALGFHWPSLPAGRVALTVHVKDRAGNTDSMVVPVEVIRFENPLMNSPDAVRLDGATFTTAGHEFTVHGLLAEGKPYEVRLAWQPVVQRFVITSIVPRPAAPVSQKKEAPP